MKRRKPGSRKSANVRDGNLGPWEPTGDQVVIYRRWCNGESQTELAKELGCNQSNVSKLCKQVEQWLVARTIDDIRGLKLRQTSRMERYIEELEAAWERSKKDAESKTVEDIAIEVGDGDGTKLPGKKTKVTTSGQCGHVAYLEAAMSALDRIRKIWGADAPLKIQTIGEPRVAGMNRDDAKILYLEKKLEEERAARARQLDPQSN